MNQSVLIAPPTSWRRRLFSLLALDLLVLGVLLAASPSFLFASAVGPWSRLVCGAGVVAWALVPVLGASSLRPRLHAGRGPGAWLLATLAFLVTWLCLFHVCISWSLFLRTGYFVNAGMLEFLLGDPGHVLRLLTREEQHIVAAAAVLSLLLNVLLWRLSSPPESRRGQARRLLAGLGGSAGVFVATFFVYPPVVLRGGASQDYAKMACYRTTPGLALLCSALARAPQPDPAASTSLQPRFDDLGRYVATVPESARRLNVVLIVVESLRRDSLRSLGGTVTLMPFLDRMAETGLTFSDAYAQSNATDYSVPSILSSLYPLKFPVRDNFRSIRYPKTLVYEVFAALGYRTAIFSSHNDRWGYMYEFMKSPSLAEYFYPETYDGEVLPDRTIASWAALSHGYYRKASLDDGVTVSHFLEWMRGVHGRFFSYLNFQASHVPYEQALSMEHPFVPHELDFDISFYDYPRSKRDVMLNRYRNSLHFVDQRIRDVVMGVQAAGHGDDTIFVVLGDHGESFFEHGAVTHAQGMPEEVLRVPLVFQGPADVVPHRVDARPVCQVDVLPVLFGMLGLPPHPNFQGSDVLHSRGDPEDHRLLLTTQHLRHENVLVWRGFKYILDDQGEDRFFDLRNDPGEDRDLSRTEAVLARRYRKVLTDWMAVQLLYYRDPRYYEHYFPPRFP